MRKLLFVVLWLLSSISSAQQLSASQVVALRALVVSDTTALALANAGNDSGLAAWLNTDTVTYMVWRSSVTSDAIMQDASFDWTRVDNLSIGKARIWDWMFRSGSVNPTNVNIRTGTAAVWVGTAADLAVQAAILAKYKRSATRAEKALASGTGTTAVPATLSWEGQLSYNDASLLR